MFQGWLLIAASLTYIALLFGIAWLGDRRAAQQGAAKRRPIVYSLALAVYCTSWTFYGSVGQAATQGWSYASIFIGPILTFVLFWPVLAKMIRVAKRQNVTSIADFIASRYGKSQELAAFTSVVVLIGTLPYIALQLKAMSSSLTLLTDNADILHSPLFGDTAFYIAMLMAIFAILFGTRHTDATEHHEGLIQAIAFESVIKLAAFLLLGAVITWGTFDGLGDLSRRANEFLQMKSLGTAESSHGFWTQTLLAMLAMFCVPRQFHVTVVENTHPDDSHHARWLFPLYLALAGFFVLPLATAGLSLLPAGSAPDSFVLLLPMTLDNDLLTFLTFIGGFAAASGMVIMAGVTLAIMISNEVLIPLLLKLHWFDTHHGDYAKWVLRTRRLVIVLVLALAYGFYRLVAEFSTLSSIGMLSLAALAQLAPALLGGLYWKKGNRFGASVGLGAGIAIWAYTLLLPALDRASLVPTGIMEHGPFGVAFLAPGHLFGFSVGDPLTQGVMLSLGVNLFCYIFFSQSTSERVVDRIQASQFVDSSGHPYASVNRPWQGQTTIGDLKTLCKRFLSDEQVERAFRDYHKNRPPISPNDRASIDMIQFSERLLSSAIGASSARIVINSGLSGREIAISDVVSIVDEASQVLEFNRALLQAAIENFHQGVMVVDHRLRLVVWNQYYLELFGFPDNMIRVGAPIDQVFRYNAEHNEYGPGDPEEHVNLLIDNIKSGQPHHYQRYRPNGTVLDVHGNPMAGGGFVYTYQDITQQKRTEEALIRSENNIRIYTDNVPALIAYFDRECRFLFANHAYEEAMNVDRASVIGKRAEDVMSRSDWRERAPWMLRALAGERVSYELSMTDDEGGTRYMLATYTPHHGDQQRVLGLFALYQDITERRLAEIALKETNENLEERVKERTQALSQVNEALRQENKVRAEAERALRHAKQIAEDANASKTRFLAAASHDLLQPLNAARLFTSALTQQMDDQGGQKQTLTHIDNSLQAAEELLSTLLDISKLDAGALTPKRSVFRLKDIFAPLQAEFEVMASERGLDLSVVTPHHFVDSDPQMLRRIVQNFLSNALRYTQEGRVLLGCRRRGANLVIEVWDTGPGIPESKQSEIFQEFQRLDQKSRHRESEKGLGLGLSIADRMARVLDHSIRIRSWVDRGSVFSVEVPIGQGETGDSRAEASLARAKPANKLSGARVLCIDNETLTLEGMKAILTGWNIEVYTATSIGGAKSVLRNLSAPPDAILADYHLDNEVTGLMALDVLLEGVEQEVPGIVITADRTEEVADEVKKAGFHMLNKPVKPAALRALLTRALQASRSR